MKALEDILGVFQISSRRVHHITQVLQGQTVLGPTGVAQVEFNNQTLDKRCMSTVQLLIDIESLSHTDYMTGTLNSGIPYLIEARPPVTLNVGGCAFWCPYWTARCCATLGISRG